MKDLRKFRIEECDNGWLVAIQQGKDEFVGRHVFNNKDDLITWLNVVLFHTGKSRGE